MHPALNIGVASSFVVSPSSRTPPNRTGAELVAQMRALQAELFRLRRDAVSTNPPVQWTIFYEIGGVHSPSAVGRSEQGGSFAQQLLRHVGSLASSDIFSNLEISLCAVSGGGERGGVSVVMETDGSDGGSDVGSEDVCAEPVSLGEAMRHFWADVLSGDLQPPLFQLPQRRSVINSETVPGLPPDAPLPPTDGSISDDLPLALEQQAALGRLLLICLAHGVPLASWLPPSVFQILLGGGSLDGGKEALRLSDLQSARPRMACRCSMMLSSIGADLDWADLEQPSCPLPPPFTPMAPLVSVGSGSSVHDSSCAQAFLDPAARSPDGSGVGGSTGPQANLKLSIVNRAMQWRLLTVRQRAANALGAGFKDGQPAALSEIFSHMPCESLMLAGCGGVELTADALLACIEFDGFDQQSLTPDLLRSQLRQFDWLQRRLFVLIVTGRVAPAALPPRSVYSEDTWEGVVVIRHWQHSMDLPPQPLRAAWDLLLPDYNDAAQLRHMLAKAMSRLTRQP